MLARQIYRNVIRYFSRSPQYLKVYEGEGKTTLHIMNKDEELGLMINGYSQAGFRLNNNMTVLGPMIIFSRSVLAWNIDDITDVTEDSLCLFKILEPKIDIIVLGTGDKIDNHNFFKNLLVFSKKHRISFEILPTEAACPTFNFLNAEGRNVVGAMIPPQTFTYTEDDELTTKLRYQNLYENN
ncbi:NADH dehydrogenase [ubiquinone] 1 alpha subcomplex assembly factor 3 [Sitophilus oryzae]|uniref:NADH dehydrogenase [ubiquinone] 1 alpha subcomplex assembly factor 3 n=1 Tax=Sitophilus oryzae TaxID=7048 RepID=A0A6J2YN03_SITOR|nr:NADH dehydrogenase [ubiquinone] 1 alpha subcomplex assembly factor 3 [Sitophilus oryzae]XP_030765364.1 NADH dehydrogenase [ubiquinone] 1 alpha subcomplex assembly factor 3 [Sitophilus oryzae]XP_030765365.1 NADH dehydrogenase [ubiquinone] 1 alpha subcomplex assembly factor 3 [Sitophilus oryzae]